MSTKLKVTELDFEDIKTNLKTYLKNQTEFTDYDFEGSGMAVMVDLLAYNTHYLAMNANLAMNEAFLDSSVLRGSVVSHAKVLGYTPRSPRSPIAYVDITLNSYTSTTATMNKGTKFVTKIDNVNYNFVTNEAYTTTNLDNITKFSNIPLYEGTLVKSIYNVVANEKYIMADDRVDTTTLKVSVQTSSSDDTTAVYTLATDITQLSDTSEVYFLQEIENSQYEIYFGDDVVGKNVEDGNIVTLEYIVTNKTLANTADSFTSPSIDGHNDITIDVKTAAFGGANAESTASVKYSAPLDYASQGRAVTTDDYRIIVPTIYSNAKSVQVWGGEDNDPPIYGQVYISINTTSGTNLTQSQKDTIANSLKKYNVASIRPVIIDPDTISIILDVNFKYDSNKTTKSADDLKTLINTTITNYNTSDLGVFNGLFRFSKLSKLIDDTDGSILSNITKVNISKTFTPTSNTITKYELNYNNKLHSGHHESIVSSTGFNVSGYTQEVFFEDDHDTDKLRLFYWQSSTSKFYINDSFGTIDYATGNLVIGAANITSSAAITATVKTSSNDVIGVRNSILDINITNTTITGELDTIVSGGSSAGTGYTTADAF